MNIPDKQHVKRCLNGHPEDFGILVERYQKVLLGFLVGRFGGDKHIEDAVQETFVRAYFNLKKLGDPEHFYSWLLGIAQRVAQEHIRVEQKQRRLVRMKKEDRQRGEAAENYDLEKAIARLPDSYQQLILLRFYGGLSCRQLAKRLSLPLGTVTKRLSCAYQELRELLRAESPSETAK